MIKQSQVTSFWRRLAAYMIDVVPVLLIGVLIAYQYLGFDEKIGAWRADRNPENTAAFYAQRNLIRDWTFLIWVVYCAVAESSPWQGTLGKRLLGIQVVDAQGARMTLSKSVVRNAAKVLSYVPCSLGFLWALCNKRRQAWHDLLAKTQVVDRPTEPVESSVPMQWREQGLEHPSESSTER